MRFRYLGDKEDMAAFGHDFSEGKTPDVTDENAIKKLSGNPHFEAIEEGGADNDKQPTVNEKLKLVAAAANQEDLEKLAEGEDRKTVMEAIEKKKTSLSQTGSLPLD